MPRFYIGQPVICVDDRLRPHVVRRFPGLQWPREGGRYTIRANIVSRGLCFVLLREIRNRKILYPQSHRYAEAGFWEERFEPATNIDLLKDVATLAGMLHERHMDPVKFKPRKKRVKEDA